MAEHGLSKRQFVQRADSLCAKYHAKVDPIAAKADKESDPARQGSYLKPDCR